MATENEITLTSLRDVILNAMDFNNEPIDSTTLVSKSKNKDFFICKRANEWVDEAKNRATPKMLLSEFWYEGELCILFSDTNLGKSILAVQIANIISKGDKASGFKLEAEKQKVLYFDFELTDKQFENRYSDEYENHYQFDSNFMRVELNPDMDIPKGMNFEDCLYEGLEKLIIETGSKILIVDNITFLKTETENAKNALPLMKQLKELKSKYGLSMLVLAHCPKRDLSKPITKNDLAGSKMIINFCDSSFTIGESNQDKNLRYLKQIKQRNTGQVFDSENVIVCEIFKDCNYLHFKYIDKGSEDEHIRHKSAKSNNEEKDELIKVVKELSVNGMNQRQIAEELGIGLGTVNKYLKL
jgi:hypothetical protein